MPEFHEVIRNFGFLTDQQISQALQGGYLLDAGTWHADNVRHASYTLRLGGEVRVSRARAGTEQNTREFNIVNLTNEAKNVELRPGDIALLYSMERLNLPDCVLGFTVARGLLFAEGLCPENTYIDPGFSGTIYTTVTNVSNRIIQLQYGMPIARLFFFRLSTEVTNSYRAGHALGIAQQLTSVRAVAFGSADECRTAPLANLTAAVRELPIAGNHAAECIERLQRQLLEGQRRLVVLAIFWPILLLAANNSTWITANVGTFAANVAASIVAAGIVLILPKLLNRFAGQR